MENVTVALLIAGPRYSGKGLLGDLVEEKSGFNWFRAPFAGTLKNIYCLYKGITKQELEANKESHRSELQTLGTEVLRAWKEDFHVKCTLNQFKNHVFIVDDARFFNEYENTKNFSAVFRSVWITSSQEKRKARCENKFGVGSFQESLSKHVSENGFTGNEDFWDYKIINDLDTPDLLKSVAYDIASDIIDEMKEKGFHLPWPL